MIASDESDATEAQPLRENSLQLFPNPNHSGQVQVRMEGVESVTGNAEVIITNTLGEQVATHTITVQDGMINTTIDLPNSAVDGLYTVTVRVGDQVSTQRLVMQR
jgi:Secretion system C-terminal sorting domain